ncbi:hypothetical protein [Desulfobacula sp.]|uniref:hypothetical protein n=1 Tax=Desulfobacula sp. TaxID=2593537 RepID=UPI0026158E12|nr:hypothetical protein [Desulfobacula sp.]
MDFDSIITILFIIGFFILPSILKQFQARKKKTAAPKTPKKNPSLLDRVGEQISQFIQGLEQQGQQSQPTEKTPDTLWDTLAEDNDGASDMDTTGEDADMDGTPPLVPPDKVAPEKGVLPEERPRYRSRRESGSPGKPIRRLEGPYCFKSNPLQNAVIWLEILSKPVGLRDE